MTDKIQYTVTGVNSYTDAADPVDDGAGGTRPKHKVIITMTSFASEGALAPLDYPNHVAEGTPPATSTIQLTLGDVATLPFPVSPGDQFELVPIVPA